MLDLLRLDDSQAFRTLYDRYWDRLLMQALMKLKSPEDAEEVVQEVFLNLWKRRSSVVLKYTFHTYIASAVKYEVLFRLSRRKKKSHVNIDVIEGYSESGLRTDHNLEYESLRLQIEETVQSLPEKCRIVFRLSREAGLTAHQIAKKMDISRKTVEAHIGKALKMLRDSLQHYFF